MPKYSRVEITPLQVSALARRWPCSGLPEDVGLSVEFAPNGDLVALEWADGNDYWEAETSGALLALVYDASQLVFDASQPEIVR